jgi:hypothetical protein
MGGSAAHDDNDLFPTVRSTGDTSKSNTVHLQRPGMNLDLLDCKANIVFAYLLHQERGFLPE